ncbi:MAG: hypothetical protein BWY63_01319 [Chloroflexi bacterium ADurb.Bin360]|nr:MAG: hypothetical protein BWY63_01319 [Chloroflexi bacterium ADurb.Bin360]
MEGVAQKSAVASIGSEKGLQRRGVGDIAAFLPADEDFLAGCLHLLQKQHVRSEFSSASGSH